MVGQPILCLLFPLLVSIRLLFQLTLFGYALSSIPQLCPIHNLDFQIRMPDHFGPVFEFVLIQKQFAGNSFVNLNTIEIIVIFSMVGGGLS